MFLLEVSYEKLNCKLNSLYSSSFFSSVLLAQSQEILEKYSKVKITIQDKSDLKELQQAGLSLEGMKLEEQSVEVDT